MRAYIEESLYKKKLTEYKMRLKVNIQDEKQPKTNSMWYASGHNHDKNNNNKKLTANIIV